MNVEFNVLPSCTFNVKVSRACLPACLTDSLASPKQVIKDAGNGADK